MADHSLQLVVLPGPSAAAPSYSSPSYQYRNVPPPRIPTTIPYPSPGSYYSVPADPGRRLTDNDENSQERTSGRHDWYSDSGSHRRRSFFPFFTLVAEIYYSLSSWINDSNATYTNVSGTLHLAVLGLSIVVEPYEREARRLLRGRITHHPGVLDDLLADSWNPLSQTTSLSTATVNFLSAFVDGAKWVVTVMNRSQYFSVSPETVFLLFRFPYLRFEWRIRTPNFTLQKLSIAKELPETIEILIEWHAYADIPRSTGLVANGTVLDTITFYREVPQIQSRRFAVDDILQPELLRPRPLPRARPRRRSSRTPRHEQETPRRTEDGMGGAGTSGGNASPRTGEAKPGGGNAAPRTGGAAPSGGNAAPRTGGTVPSGKTDLEQPPPRDNDPRSHLAPHEMLLRYLRSLHATVIVVTTIAVVLASSQPLIDQRKQKVCMAVTIIGVVGAAGSALSMIVEKVLQKFELALVEVELTAKVDAGQK